MSLEHPNERATDRGWLCRLAIRAGQFWDFIDKRDIDKHFTAQLVIWTLLIGTYHIGVWGFQFAHKWLEAAQAGKTVVSGTEVAAVLVAVCGPWSVVVSAVVPFVTSFYFKART